MEKAEIILSGPEFQGEGFLGSIAEYVIPKMKSNPKDWIVQVDIKTNEKITNYEFLRKSIGIAEGVREFGVAKGDIVVLAADNCINSHAAFMGIMFSGAIVAPLNKNLKPREMEPILAQFEPKYVICESEKADYLKNSLKAGNIEAKIILLDSPQGNGEYFGWNDIMAEVDVDNYTPRGVADGKKELALISCSSGSTGLPKGVAISHYSVLFNNSAIEQTDVKGLHDTILLTSPLFWISATIILVMTCVTGRTRYIPKSTEPKDILEAIQEHKPYFALLSPASLLLLVEHPDFNKYNLESLKVLMTGGSVLRKSIADKVLATWKDIVFYQGYGMTEVAGALTVPAGPENVMSVGSLILDIKLKIVDTTTGESLGANKVGEARIKTRRIMNGYYKNEKATREAFDENGWYRTGDLAYYDENGLLYIVGRIKEVIKYRNHQICPDEIESFINGLDGVKDVAVVPVPDERDGHHLRALVVRHSDSDITADYIIQEVKENFSDFKHLRKGVQFVDILPRSDVGKLKRSEVIQMI